MYFDINHTINEVKYKNDNKRMWLMTWRPYSAIILCLLRMPTKRKIEVALEFKIVNIVYRYNTAHFSVKIHRFYIKLANVLHVLTTIKQKRNIIINN